MPNPIQEKFGNGGYGPFGNAQNMMDKFQQFTQYFQGDPEAIGKQLLKSGQMTQEQFNQYSNIAMNLQPLFQRMLGGGR